jgi:adenosine/AMP kinase
MKQKERTMELRVEKLEFPEGCNVILGHSHFIKTVEDLYEVMMGSTPNPQFGLAFCEASCSRLIRKAGTDDEMMHVAVENAKRVGAGHTFIIVMKDIFPINVLNAVKGCQEVCRIFCATANPVEVILAETEQGRGIVGVVDGLSPLGVESESDVDERKALLRDFGYKVS